MARRASSVGFFSLFLVLFLLASMEVGSVMGNLCERPSQTWSGNCGNTGHCDNQCKSWEGAAHGACHSRGGHKCFCYFNCPQGITEEDFLKLLKEEP